MNISFIYNNINGEFRPHLGILYVLSYLEKNTNHKVSLIDPTFHRSSWNSFLHRKLKAEKPDVVGINSYTFRFPAGLQIARVVRDIYPDVKILFGGTLPTLYPEKFLQYDEVDAVCIGEGEYSVGEFVNKLENGESLRETEGIWYKDKGKIVKNKIRPLPTDLDVIPFPNWDHYDLKKYMLIHPHQMDYIASRGCPYNCSFCSNHALRKILPGQYVRFRTPENVIEEILLNKRKYWSLGFRYIYFWDDIFVLNKKFLHRFCKLFIQEKLNEIFGWNCTARPDLLTKEDILLMKKANCNTIRMGVEAGDAYIRNSIYNKNLPLSAFRNTIQICHSNQINVQLNFIFGGPHETIQTMQKTYLVAKALNPDLVVVTAYAPLPKTKALQLLLEEGAEIQKKKFKYTGSLIERPLLKSKDISKAVIQTQLYFILKSIRITMFHPSFYRDLLKFLYHKFKYNLFWHDAYFTIIRKLLFRKNKK